MKAQCSFRERLCIGNCINILVQILVDVLQHCIDFIGLMKTDKKSSFNIKELRSSHSSEWCTAVLQSFKFTYSCRSYEVLVISGFKYDTRKYDQVEHFFLMQTQWSAQYVHCLNQDEN